MFLFLAGFGGPRPKDTLHPHPLVVCGRVAGRWGRKQGKIRVKLTEPLPADTRDAIAAEALSVPVPNASTTVEVMDEL